MTNMRLKAILIPLLIVITAAFLGSGYAIHSLRSTKQEYTIQNACWRVNKKMDLQDSHQRALVAMIGLFALRESEVLYFVASEDSEGRPLDAQYDYVLEGLEMDARYWSYTLYGADFFLVKNEANKFGFNMDNVQYDEAPAHEEYPSNRKKTYTIQISSTPKTHNWLPSSKEGQFHINLRMYNPEKSVYENLDSISLPTIRRIEQ